MKIAQISDTHINTTTKGQIKDMLRNLSKEDFDIIVHCGDYCGGMVGHKSVKPTVEMIRGFFPNKPFISTIGNHDLWNKNRDLSSFNENYGAIKDIFSSHNVIFIDEQGPVVLDGIAFLGHCGWYSCPNPDTNDRKFLPIGLGGDTNRYLLKKAEDEIIRQSDTLDGTNFTQVAVITHFPIINTRDDWKGAFEAYSWNPRLGDHFIEKFNCKFFLNGHAHQLHKGPLRWECGSDYGSPKYQIIEI